MRLNALIESRRLFRGACQAGALILRRPKSPPFHLLARLELSRTCTSQVPANEDNIFLIQCLTAMSPISGIYSPRVSLRMAQAQSAMSLGISIYTSTIPPTSFPSGSFAPETTGSSSNSSDLSQLISCMPCGSAKCSFVPTVWTFDSSHLHMDWLTWR